MHILPRYPQIYGLGHNAILDLFEGPVLVEEKIDGSQISFGMFDGELQIRSKNIQIHPEAVTSLFTAAVDVIVKLAPFLIPNWIYRGEYLAKPKHNCLAYDRIPKNHIILYDINSSLQEAYLSYTDKAKEADRLGLEVVPVLFNGTISSLEFTEELLKTHSCLGDVLIEGVVVKNYAIYTSDKKVAMGKFVSKKFKERNQANWKAGKGNVVLKLIEELHSERRWEKAIERRRDSGELLNTPQDIGPLLKAINLDILKEEKEAIMQRLFKEAWPKIAKGITTGFPEWYKQLLNK